MSIVDDLERLQQRLGRRILLPTPPMCQALIAQARASGIALGTLFVVSRALCPGVQGSYDRQSQDLWCHFDASGPEGAQNLLWCLLTIIAYVKLGFPVPRSVDEDWAQTRAAHQEAFALAQEWQWTELCSEQELASLLAADRHFHRCHVAAGALAGSLDPSLARNAYRALLEVRARYQWSETEFEAALEGMSEDDAANAAVLDFDRAFLRARWHASRTSEQPDPLGSFARAQTVRSARILRSALEQLAYQPAQEPDPLWLLSGDTGLSFLQVTGDRDLQRVLALVNGWLAQEYPERAARAWWRLYANVERGSARLYQFHVDYEPGDEEAGMTEEQGPAQREVWVLFPARHRREPLEAAWQRYLLSWLTFQDLQCDSLHSGLHTLWSWLER